MNRWNDHDSEPEEPSKPSKSQKKRDMTALQKLGETLVELSTDKLARIPMSETLAEAVSEARSITDHEGRRRQLQYIGKIMRTEDVEPIRQTIAGFDRVSRAETAALHHLEGWRDRLIEDDSALDELIREVPACAQPSTLSELRRTIRAARAEKSQSRAPRHFRELFQLLKRLVEGGPNEQ